jgi:hypothetical protein
MFSVARRVLEYLKENDEIISDRMIYVSFSQLRKHKPAPKT